MFVEDQAGAKMDERDSESDSVPENGRTTQQKDVSVENKMEVSI